MKKMYLSITYELYPIICIKSGEYNLQSHGEPGNWFIHHHKNSDFIKYNFDTEKIISVETPIITVKYNQEKYLYIFHFYNYNENSPLRNKMNKFLSQISDAIHKIDINQYLILSNKLLDSYDTKIEASLDKNDNIIEDDNMGGSIYFSKIRNKDEVINEYNLISGIQLSSMKEK